MFQNVFRNVLLGVLVVIPSVMYLALSQGPTYSNLSPKWAEEKSHHQLAELDDKTYKDLIAAEIRVSFQALLDPMLIPRVSGSPNNAKVRKFISTHMTNLGWTLETDAFHDNTPHGEKSFENIIATLNPDTPRRLVLACHYDSKYSADNSFIGATDSAVPCAMMLHLAAAMEDILTAHKNSLRNVTLQYIFFDGEEAFKDWTSTDSLYGSRHLASKWGNTPYPPDNDKGTTMLHRMDLLALLDLLGTEDIKLYTFFNETSHWHKALVQMQDKLKRSKSWEGSSIFDCKQKDARIEDDHIPFLRRGVDILHLIPDPFPVVWHKNSDTKSALHFPTISNLNKVFRIFVARYLHGGLNGEKRLTECATNSAQATPSGILQHVRRIIIAR